MTYHDDRRYAPATLRNRDAILEVLRSVLPASGLVVEVASGTGEHVVHFAHDLTRLEWQPSDPSPHARRSILAWAETAALTNLCAPLDIDAAAESWGIDLAAAIICINMTHISPWASTVGLMREAGRVLTSGAPVYLYGPFRRTGRILEPSNEAFDHDLRMQDPRWGLRDLDDVIRCAADHGLSLASVIDMPANNLSVVFMKD